MVTNYHGNPQPSFLGVITHILGVENLHFSWFWGPRVLAKWDNPPSMDGFLGSVSMMRNATDSQLSNEKKWAPGCLGFIGDGILPSCMGIKTNHYKVFFCSPTLKFLLKWRFCTSNLGGTAIGTGIAADPHFSQVAVQERSERS